MKNFDDNHEVGEGPGYFLMSDKTDIENGSEPKQNFFLSFFSRFSRAKGSELTTENLAKHNRQNNALSNAFQSSSGPASETSIAETVEKLSDLNEKSTKSSTASINSSSSNEAFENINNNPSPAKSIAKTLYEAGFNLGIETRAKASKEQQEKRASLKEGFLKAVREGDIDAIKDINQQIVETDPYYKLLLADVSLTGSCIDGALLKEALAQENVSDTTKKELHKLALKNAVEHGYADIAYIEKYNQQMKDLGVTDPMKEKLNDQGQDLLHLAALNQANLVAPLLRKHVNEIDVNSLDNKGFTPLARLAEESKNGAQVPYASLTAQLLINAGSKFKDIDLEGVKDNELKEIIEFKQKSLKEGLKMDANALATQKNLQKIFERQQRAQAVDDGFIELKQIAAAAGAGFIRAGQKIAIGTGLLVVGAPAAGVTVAGASAAVGLGAGVVGAAVGVAGGAAGTALAAVAAPGVPAFLLYSTGRMAMAGTRAFEDTLNLTLKGAEKLGAAANEAIRSVYNSPRLMSADSKIKAAIKALDVLESSLQQETLSETAKRALSEVKAQEKLYFKGKHPNGDKLSDKEKQALLHDIHMNHNAVYREMPENLKESFNNKNEALLNAIDDKTNLLKEITNARSKRDNEREAKDVSRNADKEVRGLIRANHNDSLYANTIGVYESYVLQPVKEFISTISPGLVPETTKKLDHKAVIKASGMNLAELSAAMGGVHLTSSKAKITNEKTKEVIEIGKKVREYSQEAYNHVEDTAVIKRKESREKFKETIDEHGKKLEPVLTKKYEEYKKEAFSKSLEDELNRKGLNEAARQEGEKLSGIIKEPGDTSTKKPFLAALTRSSGRGKP